MVRGVSLGGIVIPFRASRSRPSNRNVNGDQQRVVVRLRCPSNQRHRSLAVPPHVEMEPVSAAAGCWIGGGDSLDARRTHRGQGEGDARGPRGCGSRNLTLGVHGPCEASRCGPKRERHASSQHVATGVHACDVTQDMGVELHVLEGLTRPRQGDLVIRRTFGVVKPVAACAPSRCGAGLQSSALLRAGALAVKERAS